MADASRQKGLEGTKKATQKLGSLLRKPFSKSKSRTPEPTPASHEIAQDQDSQAILATNPDTLLVKTESIHFKENTMDPARKVAGYELAIAVIDIVQPVVECAEFVLPTPVGMLLEQLSKALGVLKVGSVTANDRDPINFRA
jgi:hypothetical protein